MRVYLAGSCDVRVPHLKFEAELFLLMVGWSVSATVLAAACGYACTTIAGSCPYMLVYNACDFL